MPATDVETRIEDGVVECSVLVQATAETIFPFFTDPEKLCSWMGSSAKLDPRPGGSLEVTVAGAHAAGGSYVEVDEPKRVVFTWGWEGEGHPVPVGSSTVEVTLTPKGNATIVTLRHSDLPSDEMQQQHLHGWSHYLRRLAVAGAGGDAGPDTGPA